MSTARKKLLFFTNSDPMLNPARIETAYHFANVAAQAGLVAEVRLAGDAVKLALPNALAKTPAGDEVRKKIARTDQAGYTYTVSY